MLMYFVFYALTFLLPWTVQVALFVGNLICLGVLLAVVGSRHFLCEVVE